VSATAGIPANSYIGSIASDRLSFTLTSEIFNFGGTGTPINATATGTRTITIRRISNSVFGHNLAGIVSQNVYSGIYSLRSTPNDLQSNSITGDTTELRVKDGVLSIRAAQVKSGAWESLNNQTDLVMMSRQVAAAVGPSSHHTWTLPNGGTAGSEFMAETNGRHQFQLLIPDDNYTQFMLGVDRLITAGTNTSTMWLEYFDTADTTGSPFGTWKDVTTARVTVSLNTPIDTSKVSAWGTLSTGAKAMATASALRSIICRIMGTTTGATGNPAFTNVWTLIK
jgi:hypothetical protein